MTHFAKIELSAKHTIRAYLKQQKLQCENLTCGQNALPVDEWADRYSHRDVKPIEAEAMAAKYAQLVTNAGGFSVKTQTTNGSTTLPHRQRALVSALALEPISLGQGMTAGQQPYVENAAILTSYRAAFKRKNAMLGSGPSCIILTQHLLERIYERTEVRSSELRPLIERETVELLRALGLAEAASLWIAPNSEHGLSRITAVPYSNGLMIFDERYVFGSHSGAGLGCRLNLPEMRTNQPFINPRRLVEGGADGAFFNGESRPMIAACGATYLNCLSLNNDQADYYYGFLALAASMQADVLDALAHVEFSPSMPHESIPVYRPVSKYGIKIERLRRLLSTGWLKPKPAAPVAFALPFDHQIRSRRVPN